MRSKRITRKIVQVALIGAVVSALAPSAGAQVADSRDARRGPTQCGGRWASDATCNLRYAGKGISVKGSFYADQIGYVSVRLEAIDPETGVPQLILSCGSAATEFGACGGFASDDAVDGLQRGQELICTVTGAEAGRYRCATTRG